MMFCIVNNIDVGIVNNNVVFLTILLTIQKMVLSYCHIVVIDTILYILSCTGNSIARDWVTVLPADDGPPAGRRGGQQRLSWFT
jgi:hypothetical protein